MATLQEQRRAIAEGMAASRAPTSEAERQAIGKRIIEERTGKQVADDINRLVTPTRQRRSLPTVPAVGAVPAAVGRGVYKAPAAAAEGGIGSPLMEGLVAGETAVFAREYHDTATTVVTTDGLLALEVFQLKTITMHDANGEPVELHFAPLPEEAP